MTCKEASEEEFKGRGRAIKRTEGIPAHGQKSATLLKERGCLKFGKGRIWRKESSGKGTSVRNKGFETTKLGESSHLHKAR